MGRKSREKGKRAEREVVSIFRNWGWRAERTAPLQAGMGTAKPDVFAANDCISLRLEVKRRRRLPAYLVDGLEHADAVMLRQDRGGWIIAMPLEAFLELFAPNQTGPCASRTPASRLEGGYDKEEVMP